MINLRVALVDHQQLRQVVAQAERVRVFQIAGMPARRHRHLLACSDEPLLARTLTDPTRWCMPTTPLTGQAAAAGPPAARRGRHVGGRARRAAQSAGARLLMPDSATDLRSASNARLMSLAVGDAQSLVRCLGIPSSCSARPLWRCATVVMPRCRSPDRQSGIPLALVSDLAISRLPRERRPLVCPVVGVTLPT